MFCVKCGAKVAPNQSFCTKCGFPQSNEVELVTNEVEQVKEEVEQVKEELIIAEEYKKAEESRERIPFVQTVLALIVIFGFMFTTCIILLSFPRSTWVECGEEYWNNDRERYVRKKC